MELSGAVWVKRTIETPCFFIANFFFCFSKLVARGSFFAGAWSNLLKNNFKKIKIKILLTIDNEFKKSIIMLYRSGYF